MFALVGNPDNDTQWGSLIAESEQATPGPIQVGSTFRQVASFMGAHTSTVIEVTEYEPNRRVRYQTDKPIFVDHCRILEETPDGTKLTFLTEIDPEGGLHVGAGIMKRIAQSQMEADMEEIKEKLEAAEAVG